MHGLQAQAPLQAVRGKASVRSLGLQRWGNKLLMGGKLRCLQLPAGAHHALSPPESRVAPGGQLCEMMVYGPVPRAA